MKLIEIKDASKVFGFGDAQTKALDGIDLTIEKNEFVAIMGPSGSGKSTLMHILGMVDGLTDGEYYFAGEKVSGLSQNQMSTRRRRDIGYIFQHFNLIDRLTVIENVSMPLFYDRVRRLKRMEAAGSALARVGIADKEYYLPEHLSGGQRQRAAIARAIVNNPQVILADEPTGSLDSKNSKVIMDLLTNAHAEGNTIIMVTHDYDLAQYAQRVIRFEDGKITDDGILRKGSTKITTTNSEKSSVSKADPKPKHEDQNTGDTDKKANKVDTDKPASRPKQRSSRSKGRPVNALHRTKSKLAKKGDKK